MGSLRATEGWFWDGSDRRNIDSTSGNCIILGSFHFTR